jgi:hypothetical protein
MRQWITSSNARIFIRLPPRVRAGLFNRALSASAISSGEAVASFIAAIRAGRVGLDSARRISETAGGVMAGAVFGLAI